MATNYLKNSEAQNKVLTVAFGTMNVTGHLYCASVSGSSPTHQITALNLLGEGEWNAILGAYWKGLNIPAADYDFQPGALATGMTSGPQQRSSLFTKDVPHSRTAHISYKIPTGYGAADIDATPPTGFEGVFETKKCADYNSSGTQTGFSFTANPAREIIELLKTYCRLPNLPSSYASAAAYWLSRIDWSNWVDFRDYHETTETVDYTTLTDFEGFGLTVDWYNGTNFDTFVRSFVQPTLNYPSSSVAPALGVTPGSFSARFEGFIRAKYTETYTFHALHDNGVRVYLAPYAGSYGSATIDQWDSTGTATPGTHTGTYAMTAGTLYKIKVEWNDGGTTSQLKLEWSSSSQTQEVIPAKRLYPKAKTSKVYESHVFIETPLNVGAAIRRILYQTNSIMQDVNGQLRFFCLDELSKTPTFTFDNSNIEKFEFKRQDILESDPITEYEALFKDLDLEFPTEPATPVFHSLNNFTRKSFQNPKIVNLYNCTRWQARKVLATRAALETGKDLLGEITATLSKTYSPVAGDYVSVEHRKLGASPVNCLIRESVDRGVGEATGSQGGEVEQRTFTVQEF